MCENKLPTLGFIGTGTINSALVKAFCKTEPAYPIIVSPRNAAKAAALKAAYPGRVTAAESMQEVADRADWIFVAVLPKAAEEVYTGVKFRPEHKLVNLVATASLEQIRTWVGETAELVHIIPLVFVADVRGPIVMFPENAAARQLLTPIGDIVAVSSKPESALLQDVTGLEASFFTLLDNTVSWCAERGLSRELALSYSAAFFRAMSMQSELVSPDRVHELADEFTPGGLNWTGKTYLTEHNGIASWNEALDRIADKNRV